MSETKDNSSQNKILLGIIGVLAVAVLLLLGWRITKVQFFGVELVPPATTLPVQRNLSVPANSGWVSTGLILPVDQTVSIKANGMVDYDGNDPSIGESSPDGDGSSCDKASVENLINQKLEIECLMSSVSWGMLVGRIGDGTPFVVGSNYQFTTSTSGELFLGVNDCCSLSDNTGEFKVTISQP